MTSLMILPDDGDALEDIPQKLAEQKERIFDLKKKIRNRLLGCTTSISSTFLDSSGTFCTEDIKNQLQGMSDEEIRKQIFIDGNGWVILLGETVDDDRQIGVIVIPDDDILASKEVDFLPNNYVKDIDSMTFKPENGLDGYADPKEATLDSFGAFQFTDEDAIAARIAIVAAMARSHLEITQNISLGDEYGRMRKDYARSQATNAMYWLAQYLDETTQKKLPGANEK